MRSSFGSSLKVSECWRVHGEMERRNEAISCDRSSCPEQRRLIGMRTVEKRQRIGIRVLREREWPSRRRMSVEGTLSGPKRVGTRRTTAPGPPTPFPAPTVRRAQEYSSWCFEVVVVGSPYYCNFRPFGWSNSVERTASPGALRVVPLGRLQSFYDPPRLAASKQGGALGVKARVAKDRTHTHSNEAWRLRVRQAPPALQQISHSQLYIASIRLAGCQIKCTTAATLGSSLSDAP